MKQSANLQTEHAIHVFHELIKDLITVEAPQELIDVIDAVFDNIVESNIKIDNKLELIGAARYIADLPYKHSFIKEYRKQVKLHYEDLTPYLIDKGYPSPNTLDNKEHEHNSQFSNIQ